MLRPRLRIPLRPRLTTAPAQSPLLPLASRVRAMHSLMPLDYNTKNEVSQNGIPDFLSPAAFNIAWTQYQTHLLEKLNGLTAGMSLSLCSCLLEVAGMREHAY
jgi:Fe-Mn family superoxide dismutase